MFSKLWQSEFTSQHQVLVQPTAFSPYKLKTSFAKLIFCLFLYSENIMNDQLCNVFGIWEQHLLGLGVWTYPYYEIKDLSSPKA